MVMLSPKSAYQVQNTMQNINYVQQLNSFNTLAATNQQLTGQPGTTSYSPSGISTAVHTAAQYAALNAVAAAAVVNGSAGTPLIISLLLY
jgi:hypothetical protein